MFIFHPSQQAIIPVWGKRYTYFPVRRCYWVDSEGKSATLIPSDGLLTLTEKREETLSLSSYPQNVIPQLRLAVAMKQCASESSSPLDQVWGWSVAMGLESACALGNVPQSLCHPNAVAVSPVKSVRQCVDPLDVDAWLYEDNEKREGYRLLSEGIDVVETLHWLQKDYGLGAGDIVFIGVDAQNKVPLQPNTRLEAGIGGVGTIRLQLGI